MDQATTSTMDKKPAPRLAQQSSKLHAQDHKDVNSKKGSGGRRRQQHEWERDGASGNGGGGRVKSNNGGAGASAGRGGWGRSANRAARNREKEGGQIGEHRGDWSHDYVDDDDFISYNAQHRGSSSAKHPCNITQSFLSWWQPSNEGTRRGPNSNWRGVGGRHSVGGGAGGRNSQYGHGGSTGATKMTNSKARFLQARCQFVMNPHKEAQHVASNRVPVGVSLVAPAAVKTRHGTAPSSNLVSASSPADHHLQPLAQHQPAVESIVSEENDDPDALVPWPAVEEVLVHMTQPTHCPVCLYPPVAPQVTKCGHIYCYPCILHYLALSDKKWRACPICYEMVVRDDLKSAVCIVHPDYSVGSTISMVLMRRQRHSMQPSAILPPHDYSPHSLARKIGATRAKVLSITDREQSALEVQLAAEGTEPEACFIEEALTLVKERQQVLEVEYPEQDDPRVSETMVDSRNLVESTGVDTGSRLMFIKSVIDTDSTEGFMTDVSQRCSHKADETTGAVLRPVDTFRNSYGSSDSDKTETSSPLTILRPLSSTPLVICASPSGANLESYLLNCSSESSSASSSLSEGVLHIGEELCAENESFSPVKSLEMLILEDVREVDEKNEQSSVAEWTTSGSECLNFDLEGEALDNKKTLMSASSEHVVRTSRVVASHKTSNNAPKSTYYFYQASDGSHVYLHALNMAMLRSQYGSEEDCPATVNATIVEKDYFLMDLDLRNRFKALRHLPLCCAFETVELSLQSPLVSPDTIAIFQKRLSDRQQLRNSRAKEENLIERRNLELEEKELSSRMFTRVYSATSSTVGTGTRPRSSDSTSSDGGSGFMDFPDIASGDSGRPASSDGYSSPELATSPPTRTPQQQQQQLSFAKMLRVHPNNASSKGDGTRGVIWPSLGRHNSACVGGAPTKTAGTGAWGCNSSPQSASSANGSSGRKSSVCAAPEPVDDDALFNVPDYSQTFSQGFDLSLQAAEAAAAARQAGAEGKRSKKGRKKTKQVLLFSSGL